MLDATLGDAKFGGNRISDRLLYAYRSEMVDAPLDDAIQLVGTSSHGWADRSLDALQAGQATAIGRGAW